MLHERSRAVRDGGASELGPSEGPEAPGMTQVGGEVPAVIGSAIPAGPAAPSASDLAYGTLGPLLGLGSVGPAVRALQAQLNGLGEALAVDGIFGGQTRGAVTRLQLARGLDPDGVVGPNTRAALVAANPTVPAGFVSAGVAGPGGDGAGAISGSAPPPQVPSWYQLRSNATPKGDQIKGSIYFGTDQDALTPDDEAAMDELMKKWGDALQSGDWEVHVLGFADQRGAEEYNDDLAARRAAKVFDGLRARAGGELPAESGFETMGEEPSSMNPDDLARRRRVEIRITPHHREPNRLPLPGPPAPPREAPWAPPKDWSTEWQVTIEGGANAGELINGDVAVLRIENLKTHEKKNFVYAGVGIGASAAPFQVVNRGGPYPFTTTAPVPISVFAAWDNSHLNVGANAPTPTGQFGDFTLPNGISGEVWILGGPRAAGADAVFINTSGASSATPNLGIMGTQGPTF